MSRPGDFVPLAGAREIAATLPASAFADTALAEAVTLERALSLLLSHRALQKEADRLRSVLAELCAIPQDGPELDLALAPEVAPEEALRLLAAGMTRAAKQETGSIHPQDMADLTRLLCGGRTKGVLHVVGTDGTSEATEVTMMLIDAELDPVRITFDADGDATIHADGARYVCLSPDQLELIAARSQEAVAIWEEISAREDALLEEDGA
ncbi:hypothetical protein [Oceanicola sp. S124]|uniref:hypothetical protein n=1 Tax=Oceanicola sp. S124 TaxID=1042378 RepID=UPI00025585C0|nr:hypothetical protein [Oceanicola sp. S124]